MSMYDHIFAALDKHNVKFVVVGGIATVLQGYARTTSDLDVVIDLAPESAQRAIDALTECGLKPRLSVDPNDFANQEVRARWISHNALTVFSMHDPSDPFIEVDLFADPPIGVEELLSRADSVDIAGRRIAIASIDDLIKMKEISHRPQDIADIEALREVKESRES